MANKVWPLAKQAFLSTGINLLTANLKAMLISTKAANGAGNYYTYSDGDQYLSAVPAGARLTAGVALTTKTVGALAANVPAAGAVASPAGTLNADPVVFPAVAGNEADAIILYVDTGTDGTAQLVYYCDTLTGFPLTPSGADIQVSWDVGANKIFTL